MKTPQEFAEALLEFEPFGSFKPEAPTESRPHSPLLVRLENVDGAAFYIDARPGFGPAGKLHIHGSYPRVDGYGAVTPQGGATSINVSPGRDMWKVARDIERRFLTPYLKELEGCRARAVDMLRYAEAKEKLLAELHALLPEGRLGQDSHAYASGVTVRIDSPDSVRLVINTDGRGAVEILGALKSAGHYARR